jgi:16S rRNA (uracil1498-N3)-methyltransferase
MDDQHVFAFYFQGVEQIAFRCLPGTLYKIDDKVLCHRMLHVLRVERGQVFILFDQKNNIECTLESIDAKVMHVFIRSAASNRFLSPHITFIMPVIKKEAFEESLYSLTELGAQRIQVVVTQKTSRSWGTSKDVERAQKIMQAAAEQSKNFSFPILEQPLNLNQVVAKYGAGSTKVFFDAEGCPARDLVSSIKASTGSSLVLMVGPEGDLTQNEKKVIQQGGFVFCALTKTIMRAQQAVAVSLGLLRSMLVESEYL